jgi:ketosteroid isomerase-like protein
MVSGFRAASVSIAVALAAACGAAPAGDQFTRLDIDNIKQTTQHFSQAISERDVEKVLAHYPDNIVFMPPNSGTMRGKEWVKGYWETRFKDGAVSLTLESRDVAGHGPIAYENGTYTMIVRADSGEESRDRGKYLFVLRKGNGQWRYEYTIWNSDLPRPIVTEETD